MSRESTRFLHVANGTSTTMTIEAASIPGRLSIWADPLYEGPVPGDLTDAELVDVRTRYLAGPEPAHVDPVNDLTRWREIIEHHELYEELILWFEHDLFDQLNLIQLLTWIRQRLPAGKMVSLVCIGSFPGRPRFRGLGELTPDELAPLLDTRQPVTDAQFDLAARAWEAFRAPTPEVLNALRDTDTTALPYLAAAIVRFLQEYPWTIDGLSCSERKLLELAGNNGIDLVAAFPRMHDYEEAYYITDLSLMAMAESLSRTSPPLLTLSDGRLTDDQPLLQGVVSLTDTGRAVLARTKDKVALCGINRWLGGVHLQSGADQWRWSDERKRIVRSFAGP
jgi:hypothetical protein